MTNATQERAQLMEELEATRITPTTATRVREILDRLDEMDQESFNATGRVVYQPSPRGIAGPNGAKGFFTVKTHAGPVDVQQWARTEDANDIMRATGLALLVTEGEWAGLA